MYKTVSKNESNDNKKPMIYYSLIAVHAKVICDVNEYQTDIDKDYRSSDHQTSQTDDDEINRYQASHRMPTKRVPKYIRASKKILKKIEKSELRRPDGMGTLISGTYSYNYIHGYEYCDNDTYPILESLIFLCVLPLYGSNPNITSNEREVAFNYLSSLRRDFLYSFSNNLTTLYQQITNAHQQIEFAKQFQDIKYVMSQRMNGNFDCKLSVSNVNSEENEMKVVVNQQENDDDDGYVSVNMTPYRSTQQKQSASSIPKMADLFSGSGSSGNSMKRNNSWPHSLASAMSDKFVDFETMPLLASTSNLLGEHEYSTSSRYRNSCCYRCRNKIVIIAVIVVLLYLIMVIACGWQIKSCSS